MIGTATGVHVSITGLGCHVPERVVTNAELARLVDTSDEWITTRTGIKERRFAADPLAGEHPHAGLELEHLVEEEERVAVRDDRLDLVAAERSLHAEACRRSRSELRARCA